MPPEVATGVRRRRRRKSCVMLTPVTSIVGVPSASRIRCGEFSVTSPAVEWMWPTSMSPTSSVAVMLPLVVRKICSISPSGCLPAQSTSVLMTKLTVVSGEWCRSTTSRAVRRAADRGRPVAARLVPGRRTWSSTWPMSMSSPARTVGEGVGRVHLGGDGAEAAADEVVQRASGHVFAEVVPVDVGPAVRVGDRCAIGTG